MGYESQTITEIIAGVNSKYYLPSIQRKFVWSCRQIENLFDSIMSNYPIGTFLFWSIDKGEDPSRIDEYTFYNFINNFSERDDSNFNQEKLDKPSLKEHLTAVLDGQQRLSSLYCALRGSYAIKTSKKISPNDPYPRRELYFNLLYKQNGELENEYEFKFLVESESKIKDRNNYWLKVNDVLSWANKPESKTIVKQKIREITKELKDFAFEDLSDSDIDAIAINIENLWDKLVCEKLITYYEIRKESLDEILDIFVRVNSGGTPLSKSDLVFSTIVANWENGREQIENLLESLNDKGEHFKFDKDFIITLCLALMDFKQKFAVETFTRSNVKKVEAAWGRIATAITETVDLLVEFGFNSENLTSAYIIIPVAYYLFKRNTHVRDLVEEDKKNIRKFLIYGMVKKIFSAGVEGVLTQLLNALKQQNEGTKEYELKVKTHFDFDSIKMLSFHEKTLNIELGDIDDLLSLRKGALSFMVLSLLYPNIKFKEVKWHQDHIHPKTMFEKAKLKKYFSSIGATISDEKCGEWRAMADTLVNLQLLTGTANQEKGKIAFATWLPTIYPKLEDRVSYCKENYIAEEISLELKDFESYYKERKELLRAKLIEVLNISIDELTAEEQSVEVELTDDEIYTITGAVSEVLKDKPEGMTAEEIYNEIVEKNYYEFHAQNPLNIMVIQIKRACEGVRISRERLVKIFKIVKEVDGKVYYALI